MNSNQERIPGKNPRNDIEATITFLPTEHGGKKDSAHHYGYRPQFYYDGHDWDAQHNYPDVEVAMPGDTVRALLCFTMPEKHVGKLHVGKPFLIREGKHVVGYGTITAILDLGKSEAGHVTEK